MAQLFHKEVGIEDDRLAAEGGVIADDKIADGITEKKEGEKKNTVTPHCFVFFTASWSALKETSADTGATSLHQQHCLSLVNIQHSTVTFPFGAKTFLACLYNTAQD